MRIRKIEITEEQEIIWMFFIGVSNIILNSLILGNMIGYKSYDIYYYALTVSIVFVVLFYKDFFLFIKELDYIAFCRRILFCYFISFALVESTYIPYLIKYISYKDSQKIEDFIIPIKVKKIERVSRHGVEFEFNGVNEYLGITGTTSAYIKRNGVANFCIHLSAKRGLDSTYYIEYYEIVRCNDRKSYMYE